MVADIKEWKLIENAIKGDEASFEALILLCKNKTYNIVLSYLKDENDAMDVLQETYIKVFRNLKTFRGESKFETWVYRIAINTSKEFLKKNKKNKLNESIFSDGKNGEYIIDIRDENPLTEESVENLELGKQLIECLDLLPLEHRSIIVLRDIHGFTYSEIGQILDISLGTVKSRISRARSSFKEIWMEQNRLNDV